MMVMLVLAILDCLYLLWHDEDKELERMQKEIDSLHYEEIVSQINEIKSAIEEIKTAD